MEFDNLNQAALSALHQMFLSPGYEILEKILDESLADTSRGVLECDSTTDEDIQLINNLRGCNSVIGEIKTLRETVSQKVTESQQQFLFAENERDTHDHPWIAEGSLGKETFLGGRS